MSLREQALRFQRKHFGMSDVQNLADEIFLALLQDDSPPNLGPVTIDFGDGRPPATLRPDNLRDPSGSFRLPDLDFPELHSGVATGGSSPGGNYGLPGRDSIGQQLNINNYSLADNRQSDATSPEGANQPARFVRTATQVLTSRSVVPGKVVSGSGTTYTMRLYPNGVTDENGADLPSFVQTGVKQLQAHPNAKFPAGTWAFVWRYVEAEVITQSVIETNPGTGGEREVSRTVSIRVGRRSRHYMQIAVWI